MGSSDQTVLVFFILVFSLVIPNCFGLLELFFLRFSLWPTFQSKTVCLEVLLSVMFACLIHGFLLLWKSISISQIWSYFDFNFFMSLIKLSLCGRLAEEHKERENRLRLELSECHKENRCLEQQLSERAAAEADRLKTVILEVNILF